MAKINFDIKYREKIESGEYKVFAHEHEEQEARIIFWDNKGKYPIVALVDNEPEKFDKYGRVPGGNRGEEFSLFIVTPEPEFTEWQQSISVCLQKHGLLDCGAADRIAKNCSTELLDLARKELENDAPSIIHAQSFNAGLKHGKAEALKDLQENLANNDVYSVPEWLREVLLMAKENGKKEALKDLPRWKKATGKERFNERMVVLAGDNDLYCTNYAEEGEYYLPFPILEKLPKEDESHE